MSMEKFCGVTAVVGVITEIQVKVLKFVKEYGDIPLGVGWEEGRNVNNAVNYMISKNMIYHSEVGGFELSPFAEKVLEKLEA